MFVCQQEDTNTTEQFSTELSGRMLYASGKNPVILVWNAEQEADQGMFYTILHCEIGYFLLIFL